jgi:hypothetical protein
MPEIPEYQCCFCGIGIREQSLDPCGLALTVNFSSPEEIQESQGFFCHLSCFEERLHPSATLYVRDLAED